MKFNSFDVDNKYEEQIYNTVIKRFLKEKGFDSVFLRCCADKAKDEAKFVCDSLQRREDIDIVIDNGQYNMGVSLKATRTYYPTIFAETISNMTTGSLGWLYYSRASLHIYVMTKPASYKLITFNIKDLLLLDIGRYPIEYSDTKLNGKTLYYTQGRIVPLSDFPNKQYDIAKEEILSPKEAK